MLNKIYTFLLADDNGIGGWLPIIIIMALSALSSLFKKKKDGQKIPPPSTGKIKPQPTRHPGTIPSYARKRTLGPTGSPQPRPVQPPAPPRQTQPRPAQPRPTQPRPVGRPVPTARPTSQTPRPAATAGQSRPVMRQPQAGRTAAPRKPMPIQPKTPPRPQTAAGAARPPLNRHQLICEQRLRKKKAAQAGKVTTAAQAVAATQRSIKRQMTSTTEAAKIRREATAEQSMEVARSTSKKDQLQLNLTNRSELARAIIYSEILGKPLALR